MANIFLKFTPDVEGESKDNENTGWIEIESFSYGISNPSYAQSGSGASGGQATFADLSLAKRVDKATAALLLKAASGQHFDKAELVLYKAGGEGRVKYLEITLEKVYITSYSLGGSDGSGVPMESISCSYSQIRQKYTLQDDQGGTGASTEFGWNVATNEAV